MSSCIYIWNRECSNMVANADRGTINKKHIKPDFWSKACVRPLGGLRGWGQRQNETFSEHGHAAYQIKGNHRHSNMQHGSKYYARRPPTPTLGVKIQLFQNMVILHIKLKACLHPPSPYSWVKRSNLTFAEHDHVAYQIKGNHECSNMVANILPAAPSPFRRSKFNFFRTWSCCTSKESWMQQHGSNCRQKYNKYETYQTWFWIKDLCLTPWVDLGDGIKMSKLIFFRTWSCCISNLRESQMQPNGRKYFGRGTPSHPL